MRLRLAGQPPPRAAAQRRQPPCHLGVWIVGPTESVPFGEFLSMNDWYAGQPVWVERFADAEQG
jgi:hypothetical protein